MKDFDVWNEIKKKIENKPNYLAIKEREIRWARIGLNVGDEEDGKGEIFERPIFIVKKFNNKVAWVLPMSTKQGNPKFYIKIHYGTVESFVILSQLKLMSVKRIQRYVGKISPSKFISIKRKIINFLL